MPCVENDLPIRLFKLLGQHPLDNMPCIYFGIIRPISLIHCLFLSFEFHYLKGAHVSPSNGVVYWLRRYAGKMNFLMCHASKILACNLGSTDILFFIDQACCWYQRINFITAQGTQDDKPG